MDKIQNVKMRIFKIHGDLVTLDESTYVSNSRHNARFVDLEHGEFWTKPIQVISGKKQRHPKHGINRRADLRRTPIENILKTLKKVHSDEVTMKVDTYKGLGHKSTFVDSVHGAWQAVVQDVLSGSGHANRQLEKAKKTWLAKYGVDNPSKSKQVKILKETTTLKNYGVKHNSQSVIVKEQKKVTTLKNYGVDNPAKNIELALKQAKNSNICIVKKHWKTDEELICQGSYESKTVDFLNSNKIEFLWQPQVFVLPSGKTYRPDMYLVDTDSWVEIKGYFRKDAQEKWNQFQSMMPNSELWNKKELLNRGIYVK